MLIGNQEEEMIKDDNTGGIWILNDELKKWIRMYIDT